MQQEDTAASVPEIRYAVAPITHIDVRDPSANSDGSWTMSGYAAVFNQSTVLYDGKFVRISESIDPAAFDAVLREQPMGQPAGVVHFNLGHDMNRAVAATDVPAGQPGSLTLRADSHGLGFLARVAKDDPDGLAMASKMRTGVLKQASFAFTINRAEWTDTENADGPDESHRRLLEVKHLYDVCGCPQGAYSQAEAGLRTYARALGHLDPELLLASGGLPRQPSGGESTVSPATGGGAALRRPPVEVLLGAGRTHLKRSTRS